MSLLWNPPNLARVGMSVMDGILVRMFCVSKEMFEMVFDARTQSNNCFFCGKIDMRQNFNNCTGIATGIIADGLTSAPLFEICGGRLEGRAREGGRR